MDPKFVKLQEWSNAVLEADTAKLAIEKEQGLRKEVIALFFPSPKEGTNNESLAQGWKLTATCPIDRKIDEGALPAVRAQLRDMDIGTDQILVLKPSLDVKAYKEFVIRNPDAAKIFDQALTIKPGSVTLKLIPPKGAN